MDTGLGCLSYLWFDTLSSNETDELLLRVVRFSRKLMLAKSHNKTVPHREGKRGLVVCVYSVLYCVFVCLKRETHIEGDRGCVEKEVNCTLTLHPRFVLQFSGSVKPRRRKQDLCCLIKLLYNYFYLQLHEAGNGEPTAMPAKQKGHNICHPVLIVPKI